MGWSLGFDTRWQRDIGYGVPAVCDHSGCHKSIDRGLSYVCGALPYGGDKGCGLFFCDDHLDHSSLCARCTFGHEPFEPKEDVLLWVRHKLEHASWQEWREANSDEVEKLRNKVAMLAAPS